MIRYLAITSWLRVDKVNLSKETIEDLGSHFYCPETYRSFPKEFLFETEKEALDLCNKKLNEQLVKCHTEYLRAKNNLVNFLVKYGERK